MVSYHISLFQDTEHFLINPFGTLYSEVTASSLIKVDMQGNVVEAGTTNYGVNVQGFMMHSAVHANRPDLKCVLHLRHPPVTSVSALLLLTSSLSMDLLGELACNRQFHPIGILKPASRCWMHLLRAGGICISSFMGLM